MATTAMMAMTVMMATVTTTTMSSHSNQLFLILMLCGVTLCYSETDISIALRVTLYTKSDANSKTNVDMQTDVMQNSH